MRVLDPFQQPVPNGPQALAIFGIEVGLAHHHERPRRLVAGPEGDLVVVPAAVAVLGPVEHRRRGAEGESVQGRPARLHRHVPMRDRGKALHGRHFGGHRRHQVAGHVLPQHRAVVAHLTQRQARQQRHAALPGEEAEALRIASAAKPAVAIQIETRRETGIRLRGEAVRIDSPGITQKGGKGRQGGTVMVPVEIRQQQDVRVGRRDDSSRRRYLHVLAAKDVAQQQARTVPAEIGRIGCNPHDLGGRGTGGRKRRQQQQPDQTQGCACASLAS